MPSALADTLRERLAARTALAWLAFNAGLYGFTDASLAQLITTAVISGAIGLGDALGDAYDLRQSVEHVGFGVAALFAGSALLAFDDGPVALPIALLAVGGWFALDALQTVRHQGAVKSSSYRDGHDVYRDYLARHIHKTVRAAPKTRRELHEQFEADADDIDAALEQLETGDVVERVGSEWRPTRSPDRSGLVRAVDWLARVGRRLLRPLTLEFCEDSAGRPRTHRAAE